MKKKPAQKRAKLPPHRPLAFTTPQDLENLVHAYLAKSAEKGWTLRFTAFCIFCGVSKWTMEEYRKRPGYDKVLKKLDTFLEDYNVDLVYNKEHNTGAIFMLKCKYGYQDRTAVDHTVSFEQWDAVRNKYIEKD